MSKRRTKHLSIMIINLPVLELNMRLMVKVT